MEQFYFLFTLLPKQSNRQGGARALELSARSFDLVCPGVAPPLDVRPNDGIRNVFVYPAID